MPIWHPDGQCFMAPLRRGGLHRRHDVFSGLVGAGQNPTQEAEADLYADPSKDIQEITALAEAIEDECGSPPTLPCRHQRCSGHQHHGFDQVAGQHAANETIARSQLGEHH